MKYLWLLLLPVIWVPLIAFVGIVGPVVPWWGWAFAVVFWALLIRRRRAAHAGIDAQMRAAVGDGTLSGPLWSPTRGGGL